MEGYNKIAQLMGRHHSLAILRKFGELNMQDLLYLQAQIIHLESELRDIAIHDKEQPGREYHSRDWWSLAESKEDEDSEQWNKVLEIREKLKEFSISAQSCALTADY
jgi:hypothetical protein